MLMRARGTERIAGGDDIAGKLAALSIASRRAYQKTPFEVASEVDRPRRLIEDLAPTGKRAALFQWSGDARPFEQMIAATRAAGLVNINGGAANPDLEGYSIAMMSPLSRIVGGERQVYAPFGALAHGLPALRRMKQLLTETDTPIRLKPINLHYSIRAGETQGGVDIIRSMIALARDQRAFAISASHYARAVEGFHTLRLVELAPMTWSVRDRGALQTLRVDRAESLHIDITASRGVLGGERHDTTLYVALDPAVAAPLVVLRRDSETNARADATPANLKHSSLWIEALKRSQCGLQFAITGHGKGDMTWSGMDLGRYVVSHRASDGTSVEQIVQTDERGHLTVTLEQLSGSVTPVSISCVKT